MPESWLLLPKIWRCKHINFSSIRVMYFSTDTEVSRLQAFTDMTSSQVPVLAMGVNREAVG